jgi:hypothetical protein
MATDEVRYPVLGDRNHIQANVRGESDKSGISGIRALQPADGQLACRRQMAEPQVLPEKNVLFLGILCSLIL